MNDIVAMLQNVTRRYGDTVALDALSLDLRRGETVALLGPNGAGKTTAVRTLLGIGKPSSGEVFVMGINPRIARQRGHVAVVLQNANVPETLRVIEHLELFRSYYPHPRPLDEILDASGLRGVERKLFGALSGGQKQRVMFALAIAGDADIVLLDEPTAGLDAGIRRELWKQIKMLRSRGVAILLTTHDLQEAEALSDRIVVLSKGRSVAEGTPSEITAAVCDRKIRCRTVLPVEELEMLPALVSVRQQEGLVEIASSRAEETLRELLDRDSTLSDLEVRRASLEEAFLTITDMEERVA